MILDDLCGLYDRLVGSGREDAPIRLGWHERSASWALVLAPDGSVAGVEPLRSDAKGKKPARLVVPQAFLSRGGRLPSPGFLIDTPEHLFGCGRRGAELLEASEKIHEDVLAGIGDPAAEAVLAFFTGRQAGPMPEALAAAGVRPTDEMAFRLEGDGLLAMERPKLAAAWDAYAASRDAEGAEEVCSILGGIAPRAALYPKVRFPGAQASGASLVSFKEAAFCAWDQEAGTPGAISAVAAKKSAAALSWLLAHEDHYARVGAARILWWDDAPVSRHDAFPMSAISLMFGAARGGKRDGGGRPDPEELEGRRAARSRLLEADLPSDHDVACFFLGLEPQGGRLSVCLWESASLADVKAAFRRLDQEDGGWRGGLLGLLRGAYDEDKGRTVPANVIAPAFRAFLRGGPWPAGLERAWSGAVADAAWTGDVPTMVAAAAALAVFAAAEGKEHDMSLIEDEQDPAYLAGRALAICDAACSAANGGYRIAGRWLPACARSPAAALPQVFGISARSLQSGPFARRYARLLRRVSALMEGGFLPSSLGPDGQARLYLGFAQQQAAFYHTNAASENPEGYDPEPLIGSASAPAGDADGK